MLQRWSQARLVWPTVLTVFGLAVLVGCRAVTSPRLAAHGVPWSSVSHWLARA